MTRRRLLSVGADPKTTKGTRLGILTGILYLAPARRARVGINLCPNASPACLRDCLFSAGLGGLYPSVPAARISKTRYLFGNREEFIRNLDKDATLLERKAEKLKMRVAVRLNGTSDLDWAGMAPSLFGDHPEIVWYDYTKDHERMCRYLDGELPPNYSLTFSRSEVNDTEAISVLKRGGNVAVVFAKHLPPTWNGFPVVEGDESDARFLDTRGSVVGLTAKGKAKKDKSGFVVREA